MAYNSAHTGPQIDAAVEMLGQIQSARDATAADRDEVAFLASQVDDNASQVASQAGTVNTQTAQVLASAAEVDQAHTEVLSASETAVDAKDAAALSAGSAQASQDSASASALAAAQSQLAAGLSEQISAENAASASEDRAVVDQLSQQVEADSASAALSAQNAAAVVTGGTATLAPSPGKIPLADAQGKIDPEWLSEEIARTSAIQDAIDTAQSAEDSADLATARTARFLASVSTPPIIRDDGTPLQLGDRYVSATNQVEYIYKSSGWALNDSLEAIAEIKDPSDPAKGAALIPYDGTDVGAQMNLSRKLASYSAARAYNGSATRIEITNFGVCGKFNRRPFASGDVDDNGTVLVSNNGLWTMTRDFGLKVNPVWFGADPSGVLDSSVAYTQAAKVRGEMEPTPGRYHFKASAQVAAGGVLRICSTRGEVVFTGDKGVVLFTRTPASYVRGVHLDGLVFDGQHERNLRPYRDYENDSYGFGTAFGLDADPFDNESFVRMNNCLFKNTASLPFSISHFNDVTLTETSFFKTKDPGLRYNRNIRITGGYSEWSADNGISVSRGNKNVTITGFTVKDPTSDGIFISGWNTTGATSTTLTATGSSFTTGSVVQVFASVSGVFAPADVETLMHMKASDGTGSGVLRITGYTSSQQITAVVIQPLPASIQGVATNLWAISPHDGPLNVTLNGCIIIGANGYGVSALKATGKLTMSGTTILRTGMFADSEHVTKGSIAMGSNQLTVVDPSIFTVGEGVILDPKNSMQDYFVARINSISGSVLTVSRNAPVPYGLEDARHCTLAASGSAVGIGGNNVGWSTYAEYIKLNDNIMLDYRSHAIVLNPDDFGSVRRSAFDDNLVGNPSGLSTTSIDVLIKESVGMPVSDLFFEKNKSLSPDGRFVVLQQHGATKRSVFVADNRSPYLTAINHFQAFDLDNASANITPVYPWTFRDSFNVTQNHGIKAKVRDAVVNNAGVVTVTSSVISMVPATNGENVTDFSSALGDGLLWFTLSNFSTTNSITIKNNSSKIRTKTNADVTIPPNGSALFVMHSATLAAQAG